MNFKYHISALFVAAFSIAACYGQTKAATDYLGVSSLAFDNVVYALSWSSHPTESYYKQEYLSTGDSIEKYKKLVMLETVTGKLTVKDLVAAKTAELDKMKASNSVVHYESFEKDGEVMLDFLVSENSKDGKYLSIIERNVYRYKAVKDKNGKKCILLFGVSERAYGDDIQKYLSGLKAKRFELINAVGNFNLPGISIVK